MTLNTCYSVDSQIRPHWPPQSKHSVQTGKLPHRSLIRSKTNLLLAHDTAPVCATGIGPLQGAPQLTFWNSVRQVQLRLEHHGQVT